MADIRELDDDQLVELFEHDVESERLLGRVEAALTNLRELAGTKNGETAVKLES